MKPYIYIWCLVSKWDRFTRSRISKERGKIFQKIQKREKQRIRAKKQKLRKFWKNETSKNSEKFYFRKKGKLKEGKNREIVTKKKLKKTNKIFLKLFLKNDEFNFWRRYWRNWQGIVWNTAPRWPKCGVWQCNARPNTLAFGQFLFSSLQCNLCPLYLRLKKVSNNKRLKKKLECVLKKVTKWFKTATQ